ncbi:putative dead box ATP-dependent RNA helicase [Paragonimus heterotremus]|uniref:ATP-dependent RNA helicase n=1 Tax=Paragonimus heterotremus TaxID=100268 RepID=A0A8J4SZH6_9TREM|nr:putative dead box ATP-dependent RNA helicase [Paragonimus heterotremus]
MDLPADDVPIGLEIKKKRKKQHSKESTDVLKLKAKKYRTTHCIKISRTATTSSNDFPFPVTKFAKLLSFHPNFSQQLLKNIEELSFALPTPVQAQSIPVMLQHLNLLACAPTGSGKTAAYLIPILQGLVEHNLSNPTSTLKSEVRDVPTEGREQNSTVSCATPHKIELFGLILAPTQELVRQIWSEAVRLSRGLVDEHFLACLNRRHYADRGKCKKQAKSSIGDAEKSHESRRRELRLPRSTRVLIATPSRIGFLLSLDSKLSPFDLSTLSWLVIDECDKMLEVDLTTSGARDKRRVRSFRDQINPVFSALCTAQQSNTPETCSPAAVALFSATVPDEVANWARNELPSLLPTAQCSIASHGHPAADLVQLRVGVRWSAHVVPHILTVINRNSAVSTVKQELRYCGTEEGKLLEIRCMLVRGLVYPCLIFMESRERARDIVKEILLSDANILANVISSDKTEAQRSAIIRAFREGQLNVLVCTDLLGRGIDFKGVHMVVNYDLPPSKEEYIHRVGRTGRMGHSGRAVTFWTDADLPHLSEILKVMRRSGSAVDPELERLVTDWEHKKSNMVLGSKKPRSNELQERVIVSNRRGERRLLRKLLANKTDRVIKRQKCKAHKEVQDDLSTANGNQTMSPHSIKWLRRWNPYRKPISELSGARQNSQMIKMSK